MKYALIRLFSLPTDIIGYLIVLVVHLLWGDKLKMRDGILVTTLKSDSWPIRTWYQNWGATTFGHAMMFSPNVQNVEKMFFHESVHVEQCEAISLLSWGIAIPLLITGNFIIATIILLASNLVNVASAMAVAWLRGEDSYRNSVLEEAAYDAADMKYPDQ